MYLGTAELFGVPLLSQDQVKLRTSNFVRTLIRSIRFDRSKSPLTISGKVAEGVARDSRKF